MAAIEGDERTIGMKAYFTFWVRCPEIANNFKVGKDFKEYDKFTYECKDDDIWLTVETPMDEKTKSGQPR